MRAAVLYGPRDVRLEDRETPRIIKPTDAILRLSATCICGSDLGPYRGIAKVAQPTPMGHEYCGIVEEVGKGSGTSDAASSSSVRLRLLTIGASSASTDINHHASNASG